MLADTGDRWGSQKRSLTVCHASTSIVTDLSAIALSQANGIRGYRSKVRLRGLGKQLS